MDEARRKSAGDLNQIAASIVNQTTGQAGPEKNPAAVALGRLGGLKGGKARAKALTKAERREIARRAGLASGKARSKE